MHKKPDWPGELAAISDLQELDYALAWADARERLANEIGSYPISEDSRYRLLGLKNRYLGERIFILGNGPSLDQTPLALLKGEFSFISDRAFILFERLDFFPTFYTAKDWRIVPKIADQINCLTGMTFFFEQGFHGLLRDDVDVFWFSHAPPLRPTESQFSTDVTIGVRKLGSATGSAIQLARYMGFNPIYLLGCDTGYQIQHDNHPEGTVQNDQVRSHQPDDPSSAADPRNIDRERRWPNLNIKKSVLGHIRCKEAIESLGGAIYDASTISDLNVYPCVDFDSLFQHPNRGKGRSWFSRPEPLNLNPPDFSSNLVFRSNVESTPPLPCTDLSRHLLRLLSNYHDPATWIRRGCDGDRPSSWGPGPGWEILSSPAEERGAGDQQCGYIPVGEFLCRNHINALAVIEFNDWSQLLRELMTFPWSTCLPLAILATCEGVRRDPLSPTYLERVLDLLTANGYNLLAITLTTDLGSIDQISQVHSESGFPPDASFLMALRRDVSLRKFKESLIEPIT